MKYVTICRYKNTICDLAHIVGGKMAKYFIKVKDKEIPVIVRNYKNTNSVKMFFKGNILNISKSKYLSNKELLKIIDQNEDRIYSEYLNILSKENKNIKNWYSGESISYKGEEFKVDIKNIDKNMIKIMIDEKDKLLKIEIPHISNDEERKSIIDKYVKKFLAMRTEEFISNRLPYWSEKMKTKYNTVKVGDTTSQYGSCIPSKKALHFSNRLIMLPEDKIDAIIVHELSHMTHANHSPQFYNLVQKYIPNYFEIDKWLKENVNKVMI